MGIYRKKHLKLTIKRRIDAKPIDWYFDLNAQAELAISMCMEHTESIESYAYAWQMEGPPANDFVSDATEFKNWLLDLES